MVLSSGFRMRKVSVTPLVLTQSQGRISFLCCPASEELGEDSTKTSDPDWPKGYPIPFGDMLNNKARGVGCGGQLLEVRR